MHDAQMDRLQIPWKISLWNLIYQSRRRKSALRICLKNRLHQFGEIAHPVRPSRISPSGDFSHYNPRIREKTEQAVELEVAARKSQMYRNIAAQVSHDIRSPLSALNLSVSSLKDVPENARDFIKSAVARVNAIATDLLNFEKLQLKPDQNSNWIKSSFVFEMVEEIISEKELLIQPQDRIKFYLTGSCPGDVLFWAESEKLKAILSNLIDNSIQAIEGKGEVSIVLDKSDGFLSVTVLDNGKGIPPDILPRLTAKGVTFDKTDGHGLGLFFAKETLNDWDGRMVIESEWRSWTRVRLEMKVREIG